MAYTRKHRRVSGCRLGAAIGPALLSALLLAAPTPAGAATLDVGGTLEIGMFGVSFTLSQYPSTIPVSVSSGGGAFADPAGVFYTQDTYNTDYGGQLGTPLFTGIPLLTQIGFNFTNFAGSFAPGGGGGGGFGGAEPLTGLIRIGVLGVVTVPVPLGAAGQTATTHLGVAQLSVTVIGQKFTTGPAIVTGITTELTRATPSDDVGCAPVICGVGFGGLSVFLNTVTLAGFDNRTTGHQGSIALVSPLAVMTNAFANVPAFLTRRASFVPEPGTLVLFGSAAVAAAAVGATRRRRRRDEGD